MSEMLKRFVKFAEDYPQVVKSYEELGNAVHSAGAVVEKIRALIKLSISAGERLERVVHSITRKALKSGCTAQELQHTVMLVVPTIGLPLKMVALSWVDNILEDKKK